MATKTSFEATTCTRCNGTGEHLFNMMHGRVCYGCQGRGWNLTKRGEAARDYYNAKLTVACEELTPGMRIWNRYDGGFETIVSIDDEIETATHRYQKKGTFRIQPATSEQYQTILAEALEYQASLTKSGKPSKR